MKTISSPATMDRTTKRSTLSLLILLFGTCFFLALQAHLYSFLGLFLFSTILCVVIRGYLPDRYVLENGNLVIDARFKKICIPFREIASVRWMEAANKRGLYRKWGSGGLFGNWGYFSSDTVPTLKMYTRRSDHWILITTSTSGHFVIAPDDPDFLYYLNQAVKGRQAACLSRPLKSRGEYIRIKQFPLAGQVDSQRIKKPGRHPRPG